MPSADRHRFCSKAHLQVDENRPFLPLPHLNTVVAFLRYLCRTKTGTIDPNGKITVNSLESFWRGLKLLIYRQTGLKYSSEDRMQMKKVGRLSFPQAARTHFHSISPTACRVKKASPV
jgi:hypothetical protein